MHIDPNDLMIYAAVVEAGSFTQAAKRLDLPKSSVSRRVAALEEVLGERLLTRTTRSLTITDFGQGLLTHARRVGEEIDAVRTLAEHRHAEPSGMLRVSMLADFSTLLLAPMLTRFTERYPRVELRPIRRMFEAGRWQTAVGSSGTAKAIERVVVANGWSDEGITRSSLKKLRRALVAAGHIDDVKLEGLADERRPVFTGGVAVMSAVFKALDIERMQVSDLALREGLLYELVGYIQHVDIRDSTVSALMQRFGADRRQASRVESTARTLLKQVGESWQLNDPEHTLMLNWASRLHEIGLVISHGSFHKHGAYILANADLPGFTRQQQALLAALVRGHRRKIGDTIFAGLPANDVDGAKRLVVLLRLSTLMHRGRGGSHKPPIRLDASDKEVRVEFPEQWLVEHPLTEAEIVREAEYLSGIGFTLQYA